MGIFDSIMGAVSNPGDTISGIMGTKNKYNAQAYKADVNATSYGGRPEQADNDVNRLRGMADAAQGRAAFVQNQNDPNGAYALQRQAALGLAPSQAQMLGQQASDQAAAAQQSLAASARGPAAMALAQQNAAANTAGAQTQIANQAMANRAGEMAQARNAYQAADAYNVSQQAANRAQNDQYQLGLTSAEGNIRGQQLQGGVAREQANSGATANANQVNAKIGGDNAAAAGQWTMGAVKSAGSALGALSGLSDETTKTSLSDILGMAGQFGKHEGGKGYDTTGPGQDPSGMLKAFGGHKGGKGYGDVDGMPTVEESAPKKDGGPVATILDPSSSTSPYAMLMGNAAPTMMMSSEGEKTGIGRIIRTSSGKEFAAPEPSDFEHYLASTRGAAYQYHDPTMPGARPGLQVGPPSAQDIDKTTIGQTMVDRDPRTGKLAIDTEKALKTGMAADAYLNDKINGLARVLKKRGE